jgi:transcriptional regulator with XRE-family HTH domain
VQRLKKYMLLTIKYMSKKLDLSIVYLSDIENNRHYPINGKINLFDDEGKWFIEM